MSSATKQFVLVDINTGERFVLNHNELMPVLYLCGRGKHNQILSQSILASRNHCRFIPSQNGFCVADWDSANGVYINGERQQTKLNVELHINDLIGLGCNDLVPDSNRDSKSRTIYRFLPLEVEQPVEMKESADPLTQNLGDVTARDITINKRRHSNNSHEYKVPLKIPKLEEQASIPDIIDISDENEVTKSTDTRTPKKSISANISSENPNSSKQSLQSAKSKELVVASRSDRGNSSSSSVETKNVNATKNEKVKDNMTCDEDSGDLLVPVLDIKELFADDPTASKNHPQKSDETPQKTINCLNNGEIVQETKFEPELNIIDDIVPLPNETWNDFASFVTPTPIKLKRVKQEPTTRYSAVDESVIILSDDEDGVFVASQLFGDQVDDEIEPIVKIKKEEYTEDYREILEERRQELHEPIVVSDSEEEDNPWYDRLLRSQLLSESRRSLNENTGQVQAENVPDVDIEEPIEEAEHMEVDEVLITEREDELIEKDDLFDDDSQDYCSQDLYKEIFEMCHGNEKTTKDVPNDSKRKDDNDRATTSKDQKCTIKTVDKTLLEKKTSNDDRMTEKISKSEKPINDKLDKERISIEKELSDEQKKLTKEKKTSKNERLYEKKKTFIEKKLSDDKETLEEEISPAANKSREVKKLSGNEKLIDNKRLSTERKSIEEKRSLVDEKSLKDRLSTVKRSTDQKGLSNVKKSTEKKKLSTNDRSLEKKKLSTDERLYERKRLSAAERLPEKKRLSADEQLPEKKILSADEQLPEKKRLSADERLPEKKILSADERLPEKKRLSADERLREKKILSADEQLPEKKRLSADERLPEKKRLFADERLPEKKRLSADERLPEKKILSADERLPEKKRLSADERLPEEKRLSADERLPEKKRLSADERLREKIRLTADECLPEKKRSSADERLPEKKRLSADERLPEKKILSADERLPEKKRLSADERLPEKKRLSADERLPEKKRLSADERLPEKKRLSADECLPEKKRSSADERLPENKRLYSNKRLPEDKILSLNKELSEAKNVPDKKQSSIDKPSILKVKSVVKDIEDEEIGVKGGKHETKGKHNGEKMQRSNDAKVTIVSDISNEKINFIERKSKNSVLSIDLQLKLQKKPLVLLEKVDSGRKILQLVEAPFLAKGEHRGVSCNIKTVDKLIDKQVETVASTSATNDREKEPTHKLTTKEKKELALKTKIEKKMQLKEQRHRRLKHKWAADSLPEKKIPSANSPFNSDERKDFRQERNKRLKQITIEKMAKDDQPESPVRRIVVKPRAKVTVNSRNDFLVKELEEQAKLTLAKEKSKTIELRTEVTAPSERIIIENEVKRSEALKPKDKPMELASETFENADTCPIHEEPILRVNGHTIEKGKDKSLELANRVTVNGENNQNLDINNVKPILKKTKSTMILLEQSELPNMLPEKMSTRATKITKVTVPATVTDWAHGFGKHSERIGQNLTNSTAIDGPSKLLPDPRIKIGQLGKSSLKENREPTVSRQFGEPIPKKRVSFDDLRTRVDLFLIDPGNTLNKCVAKDAPMLVKKLPRCSTIDPKACCPKLEQFLLHIFKWHPAWLWEQIKLDTPPPVIDEKKLVPLLSKYATYEDYYNVTEPLLVLELWYEISREFETTVTSEKGCFNYSIVNNSVTLTTVPLTKFRVTTLMLEIVVSRRDAKSRAYPGYGDLISFEYESKKKGQRNQNKVFAYITDVRPSVITPMKHFNRELMKFVQDADTLVIYTVMTKPLDSTDILINKVNRLQKISYLRSNIRMIQALQNLPISPLKDTILRPTVEDYQLPPVGHADDYPLVTKDNLNPKQLEAVQKITNAAVQRLPKVCLIHGPPGTGKSRVIVNLVTQILHVNALCYKNKTLKILVCAPSNAAIDEIVLRLLEIRKSLEKKNRFNMVRIGRTEKMHPQVKPVSLSELGVQDVKKTTSTYSSPNCDSDSVEEEKRFLQARINSLELEKSNTRTRSNPMYQKQVIRKLEDIEAKYNLLKHRQSAEKMDPSELAKLQNAAENGLLKGADVIACTLTSCYTNKMESIFGGKDSLSVCIVDEATQSAEVETLIPLMLGVKTLILVGDTNQLPATILSQKAKQFGLDQSLFARIETAFDGQKNNPIIMLDMQYRMSSPVSWWPNRYFYGGALKNGLDNYPFPLHGYKILNLDSKQDQEDKLSNTEEAAFVASLVYTLMTRSKLDRFKSPVKIGVITPYNNQKQLVIQKIRERISHVPIKIKDQISHEVNTVDSFQGQERDVILMSCVRSSGIGFLSDPQRLCVALTRAKHSLILCGNFKTFEKDPMWHALLSDARDRKVYVNIRSDATANEIRKHIVR